jgi:predicted ABC-type exoprotein transport system permease subunit
MRYLLQSGLALAVLIALPLFAEAPESTAGEIAAVVVALILVGLAFRGIVGFVRSRKPRSYPDSIMPPKKPPRQ